MGTMTTTHNSQLTRPNHAQNQDEIIHVALAIYDPSGNYSQHAGVVMTSIFENTKHQVIIHILHDETLTETNKQKFIRTAQKYNQGLELHNIIEYKQNISKNLEKIPGTFTIGALYRLFIPDLISENKIIYLDCDILVNLDIAELWNITLDDNYLAAVEDHLDHDMRIFSFKRLRVILMGCKTKDYFNSGVLLMNLKKIRERSNFFIEALEWIINNAYLAQFPDQDAMNYMFRGHVKLIDAKFNVYNLSSDLSDCIIHCWRSKPWTTIYGFQSERIYWKCYLLSAWGENVTPSEVVDIMENGISKYTASVQAANKSFIRSLARHIKSRRKRFYFLFLIKDIIDNPKLLFGYLRFKLFNRS